MKKTAIVFLLSLMPLLGGCYYGSGYYYDDYYGYPGSYYGWGNYYGGYYGDGYYHYRYGRPYNYGYDRYRYGRAYPRPAGRVTPVPQQRPGIPVRPGVSPGFQPKAGFARPTITPRPSMPMRSAPMRSAPRGGGAKPFPMQRM